MALGYRPAFVAACDDVDLMKKFIETLTEFEINYFSTDWDAAQILCLFGKKSGLQFLLRHARKFTNLTFDKSGLLNQAAQTNFPELVEFFEERKGKFISEDVKIAYKEKLADLKKIKKITPTTVAYAASSGDAEKFLWAYSKTPHTAIELETLIIVIVKSKNTKLLKHVMGKFLEENFATLNYQFYFRLIQVIARMLEPEPLISDIYESLADEKNADQFAIDLVDYGFMVGIAGFDVMLLLSKYCIARFSKRDLLHMFDVLLNLMATVASSNQIISFFNSIMELIPVEDNPTFAGEFNVILERFVEETKQMDGKVKQARLLTIAKVIYYPPFRQLIPDVQFALYADLVREKLEEKPAKHRRGVLIEEALQLSKRQASVDQFRLIVDKYKERMATVEKESLTEDEWQFALDIAFIIQDYAFAITCFDYVYANKSAMCAIFQYEGYLLRHFLVLTDEFNFSLSNEFVNFYKNNLSRVGDLAYPLNHKMGSVSDKLHIVEARRPFHAGVVHDALLLGIQMEVPKTKKEFFNRLREKLNVYPPPFAIKPDKPTEDQEKKVLFMVAENLLREVEAIENYYVKLFNHLYEIADEKYENIDELIQKYCKVVCHENLNALENLRSLWMIRRDLITFKMKMYEVFSNIKSKTEEAKDKGRLFNRGIYKLGVLIEEYKNKLTPTLVLPLVPSGPALQSQTFNEAMIAVKGLMKDFKTLLGSMQTAPALVTSPALVSAHTIEELLADFGFHDGVTLLFKKFKENIFLTGGAARAYWLHQFYPNIPFIVHDYDFHFFGDKEDILQFCNSSEGRWTVQQIASHRGEYATLKLRYKNEMDYDISISPKPAGEIEDHHLNIKNRDFSWNALYLSVTETSVKWRGCLTGLDDLRERFFNFPQQEEGELVYVIHPERVVRQIRFDLGFEAMFGNRFRFSPAVMSALVFIEHQGYYGFHLSCSSRKHQLKKGFDRIFSEFDQGCAYAFMLTCYPRLLWPFIDCKVLSVIQIYDALKKTYGAELGASLLLRGLFSLFNDLAVYHDMSKVYQLVNLAVEHLGIKAAYEAFQDAKIMEELMWYNFISNPADNPKIKIELGKEKTKELKKFYWHTQGRLTAYTQLLFSQPVAQKDPLSAEAVYSQLSANCRN